MIPDREWSTVELRVSKWLRKHYGSYAYKRANRYLGAIRIRKPASAPLELKPTPRE